MAEASGTKSGAAGGADAQPARPVVRYRFTVSTPDNRRLTSAVAAVLLPPYLDGAQWSQAQVGPGEKATMSVKAPGREGEKISFVVERRGPKEWEAVGNTSATVKDGSAQAVQEMPFLPPPEEAGGEHQIRFRACSTDGQELQSQAVQLRPAPPPAVEVKLGTAHFAHAQYTAGDVAGLSVQAHGAGGRADRGGVVQHARRDGSGVRPRRGRGDARQGGREGRRPPRLLPGGGEGGRELEAVRDRLRDRAQRRRAGLRARPAPGPAQGQPGGRRGAAAGATRGAAVRGRSRLSPRRSRINHAAPVLELHPLDVQLCPDTPDPLAAGFHVLFSELEDPEVRQADPEQFGLHIRRQVDERTAFFLVLAAVPLDDEVFEPLVPAVRERLGHGHGQVAELQMGGLPLVIA